MNRWKFLSRKRSLVPLAGVSVGVAFMATACSGPATVEEEAPMTSEPGIVNVESWPALKSPVGLDPAIESRIDELLAKMSVEEKVGQVIQSEIRHTTPEDVRTYHLGSVLNGGGSFPNNEKSSTPQDWLDLADAYWDASTDTTDGRTGIPLIWGVDAVHGHNNVIGATLFPHNIGLGAADDPDLMRRIGEATATEVIATGLDWNFGPTVAVPQDDRWGRSYEGYSENPEIVARLGEAMVKGLQGEVGSDGFLGEGKVISTAKHFVGDGGTFEGKDQGDNRASEADLRDIHGAGYVTALNAGVQVVMASFNSWHGRKLHGHKELLTDVLKGQMGFDGFVVGDWNGHGQVPGCTNGNCAASLLAGVDMFMVPEDWKELWQNTLDQVNAGEIPMERLDDAVRRILRVKIRAGVLDQGKPSSRVGGGDMSLVGAAEHRAVSREAVRKSLVLLKNNGGLLPVAPGSKVLVTGPAADDIGHQSGGWTISWQGTGNENSDFPGATSIWQGLQEAIEAAGGTARLGSGATYDEKPDVALVVYGETPYAEFQGDRDSVDYTDSGLEILKQLKADGIPTVSVFITGRPLWINPELNASDAFVVAWLPGTEGGGVADVLVAGSDGAPRFEFQGKLPFSWPKDPSHAVVDVRQAEMEPLFAFGHGGGYGAEVRLAELSEEVEDTGEAISLKTYFDGGPVNPWKLYIGDGADPRVPAPGALATSADGQRLKIRVQDRRVQEDARSARWLHEGKDARVYLGADAPVDLDRESNGGMALAFDVFVEEGPSQSVSLSMGCGEACAGSLDVTETLKGLAPETWHTVRFSLRCFVEQGTDMKKVDTPFQLATEGTLALRFSDVRLVPPGDGDASCP